METIRHGKKDVTKGIVLVSKARLGQNIHETINIRLKDVTEYVIRVSNNRLVQEKQETFFLDANILPFANFSSQIISCTQKWNVSLGVLSSVRWLDIKFEKLFRENDDI